MQSGKSYMIQSGMNGYCLEAQGDNVVVSPRTGNQNQQWLYVSASYIQSKQNGRVLDILNNNQNQGAEVRKMQPRNFERQTAFFNSLR